MTAHGNVTTALHLRNPADRAGSLPFVVAEVDMTRRATGRALILLSVAILTSSCDGETPREPSVDASGGTESVVVGEEVSAAQRHAEAWHLLEVEDRPLGAEPLLRALAGDSTAPERIRADAELALATVLRRTGRAVEAERLLRRTEALYGDLPGVGEEARAALARVAGDRTRWMRGEALLGPGRYLDLDTAGVVSVPSNPVAGAAELGLLQGEVVHLVEKALDEDFGAEVAGAVGPPWWRVRTDAGRDAWVRTWLADDVLRAEYVVRLSGAGAPLPAPRRPACVGGGAGSGTIALQFEPDERYVEYRVERRDGVDRPYATVARQPDAWHEDTGLEPGVRYGYRIVGVTAEGDESLPAHTQGTESSAGVVSGVCELTRDDERAAFDFAARRHVRRGGDLRLTGTYGGFSSASFVDALDHPVLPVAAGVEPTDPWTTPRRHDGRGQVRPGERMIFPLRGGGVAVARLLAPVDGGGVRLEYEVALGQSTMPPSPHLDTTLEEDGVRLEVSGLPPESRVLAISSDDPHDELPPTPFALDGGSVFDSRATEGSLRRFSVEVVDEYGRRGRGATVVVNRRRDRVVEQEFELVRGAGWSFEQERLVDPDEADVWLVRASAGMTSVVFRAAGGVVTLYDIVQDDGDSPRALSLVSGVFGCHPDAVEWEAEADSDERSPSSDALLVRTRYGGFAKLAVVARGSTGPRSTRPVKLRAWFNPASPRLATDADREGVAVRTIGGVELAPVAVPRRTQLSVAPDSATPDRPPEPPPLEPERRSGGVVPEPARDQEVLLSSERWGDREKSTYQFAAARRDDPGFAVTRGRWDLAYGAEGDRISVATTEGAVAAMADLGELTWDEAGSIEELPRLRDRELTARVGHVYAIRNSVSGVRAVLLRVTGLRSGDRMAFEWIATDAGGSVMGSIDVQTIPDGARTLLSVLDHRARSGRLDDWLADSDAARAQVKRLEQRVGIGIAGGSIDQFVDIVSRFTGGDVRVETSASVTRRVRDTPINIQEFRGTFAELLEEVARELDVAWRITADGIVEFVDPPETK